MRPYRLFFSHGGDDKYIVKKLLVPLAAGSGATVFLDNGEISYGDDFRLRLLEELKRCEELLVLFTRSALIRPWVLAEVGATLIRTKRIVCITYGPTERELQELGILSLIGPTSLLAIDDFDNYLVLRCLRKD